ncbi:MAG TPA: inositol monophosphatase family protein [Actinomycetota bacterium]
MFERELAFANELADRAGEIAMGFFQGEFEVRQKADSTPVTEADLAVEAMVRERLADAFPADAVLGEEHGMEGAAERVWVVDPIDGTKNFAAGIPVWGTLVALLVAGEPAVGVVGAPALGERYSAAHGAGATFNGRPTRVSGRDRLGSALVSFAGVEGWLRSPYEAGFRALASGAARTRGFGDFWGHALVARGAADVMIEQSLRTWDWAALAMIVREAGGRITQLDGSEPADHGSVVTTNGLLHDIVLELLDSGS